MRTIRQIAELTGVSIRTLQYYDEIDLLKPSKVTAAGYRWYNDEALEQLQQILFYKELDFKLKEIKDILENPEFHKTEAYRKQKQLLIMKRNRMNGLIALLEKLEKGETCMSFKEFDIRGYVQALEDFKCCKTDEVIKYWGSIEKFDAFINQVKTSPTVAELAVKQFGSIEKYTEAMKYNMEHFTELMEHQQSLTEQKDDLLKESEERYIRLTSDLSKDAASLEIQAIVHEIVEAAHQSCPVDLGEGYWNIVIDAFSSDPVKSIQDQKYGEGASDYMGKAFQYYVQNPRYGKSMET